MKTVRLPGNVIMAVYEPERIQSFWLKGYYYEHRMLQHIKRNYHGGTFIDCGACIGNHTVYMAKFCAQQVIAVEPVTRNLRHMHINLLLNDLLSSVEVVNAAVGDKGRAGIEKTGRNHGNYHLIDGDTVEVLTLDEIAAKAAFPVTLIKLDIEGGELEALKSGQETLNSFHPALFVELAQSEALSEAEEFLATFGYRQLAKFNSTPTYLFGAK